MSNWLMVVLVPYKITLLSNKIFWLTVRTLVLVPYKITLLSNDVYGDAHAVQF